MKSNRSGPWYRYGIMWLVIGPPGWGGDCRHHHLVLILAHPDPVIETPNASTPVLHGTTANALVPPAE